MRHIIFALPKWAMKLNRQTGEIIWSIGDFNNDFSFIGVDSLDGLSYVSGHTFYRIPGGENFLVYDNGNRSGSKSSQVHEFKLDEVNMTAELVWSWTPKQPVAGWHRGSAQRLSNGNTAIGWGGSSGKPSPAMTEVNQTGEIVYQISFVPPDVESYRALRFPFTGGASSDLVVIVEVVPDNSYEFVEGDSINTGITIKINDLTGHGYNELEVKKFNYAPLNPKFGQKAPRVIPKRMVFSNYAINSINADVLFDLETWEIKDPANTIVFFRAFEGRGAFEPLSTEYNPVTKKIKANTQNFGEFILATPDLNSIIFTPLSYMPADSSEVNRELPIIVQWNPIGYYEGFALQIAKDTAFTDLVVDVKFTQEISYVLETVDDSSNYFWRVKSFNDIGESGWSKTQTFIPVSPYLNLTMPDGGESWQRGLEYDIKWEDNLDEQIIIELYKDTTLIIIIDTTASDGSYKWEIHYTTETSSNYFIKIRSISNDTLSDLSKGAFKIQDTTQSDVLQDKTIPTEFLLIQNYPNPFNSSTVISYSIFKSSHVHLHIYDILGREVITLVNEKHPPGIHSVVWNGKDRFGNDSGSGLYFIELSTGAYRMLRKMILNQ